MNKVFRSNVEKETKIIRLALLIELIVVLLSGGIVFYFKSIPFIWGIIIGLFGLLAGVSILGSYLWVRFAAQPEVEEKLQLQQEQKNIEAKIASTHPQISRLEEERAALDRSEQEELARRNALAQEQVRELQEKRRQLEVTQRQTQQNALRQSQLTHLHNGLLSHKLTEANLPALRTPASETDALTLLASHQIVSANDVVPEGLTQSGLDPTQIQALLAWRQSIEANLQTTQPLELSEAESELLRQEYLAQNTQLDQREMVIKVALEKDLYDIRESITQQRERNKNSLSALRSALRGLQDKHNALLKQQQTYTRIVFSEFFTMCLGSVFGTNRVTIQVGAGLVHLAVWGLLLTQGGLSIRAAQILLEYNADLRAVASLNPPPLSGELACLPQNTLQQTGMVSRVIDGDTIEVQIDGQDFRVRYIGVDTPEPDQFYGGISLNQNVQWVAGKEVTLIQDVSDTDDFGRLLRYVLVGDVFVNYQLVRDGYARTAAYPPDTACRTTFETAQETARTAQTGIWRTLPTTLPSTPLPSALPTNPDTSLTPSTDTPATSAPAPCSCTANTLNCADFTTHLEAQACYVACIAQGAGDIHRLDGNGDGAACESLP